MAEDKKRKKIGVNQIQEAEQDFYGCVDAASQQKKDTFVFIYF